MENSTDVLLGQIEIVSANGLTQITKIFAACIKTGRRNLSINDEYFNNQSSFDREARASISPDIVDDNKLKELYVSYVQNQVEEWSNDEIGSLKTIVQNLSFKYNLLNDFMLPSEIYIVKTTGYEEGAAAYTRQLNTIVIPANMSASLSDFNNSGDPLHPSGNTEYLESIITHESFHIFSKNSFVKDKKHLTELYHNIGFHFTDNPVTIPNAPWPNADSKGKMPNFKITNPDSPSQNTYIQLEVRQDEKQNLMPLLIADRPYNGGAFFDYLQWYMVEIEKVDNTWSVKMNESNRPVMYNMSEDSDLMKAYLKKVGYNLTNEIFQADEVLAQSFVLMMEQNYPSQWVMDDLLKGL